MVVRRWSHKTPFFSIKMVNKFIENASYCIEDADGVTNEYI